MVKQMNFYFDFPRPMVSWGAKKSATSQKAIDREIVWKPFSSEQCTRHMAVRPWSIRLSSDIFEGLRAECPARDGRK